MNYGARGNSIAKDEHRPAYRSPYRHPDRGGIVYEYPYAQAAPYYFGYPYGLGFYGDDGFDTEEGYDSSSDSQVAPDDSQPYAPDQYSGFDPQQQQPAQAWPPNRDGDRYRDSYQASGQASDQAGGQTSDQGAPQSAPDSRYRPYYGTPPRATAVASEPAVTLVFKDHRPNRQIHNYLINGDTITVWDQGPHDIALDQLDIAATEKLNHDAGTDFYLPGPPR